MGRMYARTSARYTPVKRAVDTGRKRQPWARYVCWRGARTASCTPVDPQPFPHYILLLSSVAGAGERDRECDDRKHILQVSQTEHLLPLDESMEQDQPLV
jgi:hypothetical protein